MNKWVSTAEPELWYARSRRTMLDVPENTRKRLGAAGAAGCGSATCCRGTAAPPADIAPQPAASRTGLAAGASSRSGDLAPLSDSPASSCSGSSVRPLPADELLAPPAACRVLGCAAAHGALPRGSAEARCADARALW